MKRYKLIVIAGDEAVTGEYDNIVTSLKDAEIKAEELRQQWFDYGYPDAYVACYDYSEDIHSPFEDYRCWVRDYYGDTGWQWMHIDEDNGCRLYMYIK